MKFSLLSSHWICQKLMGLMGSQLKCLKVWHTALPHILPSFLIFPFAKVISLSAGRHLLLFQFPNLHVSVKPPTIDQYIYFHYRPISLLSIVSKMLERHFHQYITSHLNEYHPLSNKQWGFQSGKSTTTALLSVTYDWFQALEARQGVCSISFDLRKAFDSVSHRLLVDKLTSLVISFHGSPAT